MKYLITILCSNKLEYLKLCYNSASNQSLFTNYDIYIIINTLDEIFYNNVINYFNNDFIKNNSKLKKIIRTQSNGNPGKGHNSCINIFKNENNYDYLILLDGDDFLYPVSLYKINNLYEKTNFDVLTLSGNTKLNKTETISKDNHNYNININYKFDELNNISNISKDFNNILATPFRLLCLNKKILEEFDSLYDENMKIYDDYLYFLIFYKLSISNNNKYNIFNISDKHLYCYNNFNIISVSKNNNTDNDSIIANQLKHKYDISKLECEKIKIIPYNELIKFDTFNESIIKTFYDDLIKNLININNINFNNNLNHNNKKKILFIDDTYWDYYTIQNSPLAGTQSAIYYMSIELSNIYNICVMTKNENNIHVHNNLKYEDFNNDNLNNFKPDIIICQGIINNIIFDFKNQNKNIQLILWQQHDVNINFVKNEFNKIVETNMNNNIDKYIFVSKWQRDRFIQQYNIDYNKAYVFQNGIDKKILDECLNIDINNKKKELIYISSPYRGLLPAYFIFNEIKKFIPDIKLKVFSCFKRDIMNNSNIKYNNNNSLEYKCLTLNDLEKFDDIYNKYYINLYKLLINNSNIEFYGSVPQNILFKHMKECMIFFYPNTYPETCCTSIIEAMSHKCNIITSDLGALRETSNGFSKLFDPLIENVLDFDYDVEKAVMNPITIENINSSYLQNFIKTTINLVNGYYNNNNINFLNNQYKYVANNCSWNTKVYDFIKILNY
tara:strand:+ start:6947 stop:9130 length:2184 start_codon:yes stop_codon:yes gene_type:complete